MVTVIYLRPCSKSAQLSFHRQIPLNLKVRRRVWLITALYLRCIEFQGWYLLYLPHLPRPSKLCNYFTVKLPYQPNSGAENDGGNLSLTYIS